MRNVAMLLLTACVVACGTEHESSTSEGPLMAAGQDCLSCHSFTAAGTVYSGNVGAAGVTIVVAGATLTTNAVGNFFTTAATHFPAQVEVSQGGRTATMTAPSGACSSCHGAGVPAIQAP